MQENLSNNPKKTGNKYIVVQPLLLSLMVVLGIVIGFKMNEKSDGILIKQFKNEVNEKALQYGRVEEVLNLIQMRYLGDPDIDVLISNAIHSVVGGLDNNSQFYDPAGVISFEEQKNGMYTGIGIETMKIKDTIYITKVYKDSPAEAYGILPFDIVLGINDSIVSGPSAVDLSTVPKITNNNKVNITILKSDRKQKNTYKLEPQEIKVNNVSHHISINDSIFYIRLSNFGENAYEEFMKTFEIYGEKKYSHLLLDLRDNPGGLLSEASKILNQLVTEKGQLLFSSVDKKGKKIEYKSTGKVFYPLKRIAVIVNGGSASGSEIIAGALQDIDKAFITGLPSYGKATIQEAFDLISGGILKITTGKFYLPSGRDINNYEIQNVLIDETEQKLNLKTAHSILYKRKLPSHTGIIPDDYDFTANSSRISEGLKFRAKEFVLISTVQNANQLKDLKILQFQQDKIAIEFKRYVTLLDGMDAIQNINDAQFKQILMDEAYKLLLLSNDRFNEFFLHDKSLKAGVDYLISDIDLKSFQNKSK